jgi:hypothetical protein
MSVVASPRFPKNDDVRILGVLNNDPCTVPKTSSWNIGLLHPMPIDDAYNC